MSYIWNIVEAPPIRKKVIEKTDNADCVIIYERYIGSLYCIYCIMYIVALYIVQTFAMHRHEQIQWDKGNIYVKHVDTYKGQNGIRK